MKFQYLGTAAAEGWPNMFCSCEACKKAAAAGGKNIRTRSQAVVDDKLLIDFPADTSMHALYCGLDMTKINHCLITHNHNDHLYPADFENRKIGFAELPSETLFTVFGTQPTGKDMQEMFDLYQLDEQNRVRFQCIAPFVPFDADGYTVTPLKADHDPHCDPVFYLISDGKKSILYAHDTGYFPDETWCYLESHKLHIDFISLDCTAAITESRQGHMGIDCDIEVKERLIKMGIADNSTVFCLNHFSHNGKAIYDELVPIAQKSGFLVSYDGMTLEI